jgi:hypothetical protein
MTSVALETYILYRNNMPGRKAFDTAMRMSFLSMVAMEVVTDLNPKFILAELAPNFWLLALALLKWQPFLPSCLCLLFFSHRCFCLAGSWLLPCYAVVVNHVCLFVNYLH